MTPCRYCGILWAIHTNAASPGVLPLAVFSGGVCMIIASFGGAAATWPAMTADLFGTKHVGIIQVRKKRVFVLFFFEKESRLAN